MADTVRTIVSLLTALFQDGQAAGSITPQDMRDLIVSVASGSQVQVATGAGAITQLAADNIIIVNKTVGGATGVTLVASPITGLAIKIKDGKGDAATNNITITPAAGTIDGVATLVLASAYASASLVYNGTEWSIV